MTLAVTPYNLYGEHIKTKMTQREDKHTTGLFSRRCDVSIEARLDTPTQVTSLSIEARPDTPTQDTSLSIEASWTHPHRSLRCPSRPAGHTHTGHFLVHRGQLDTPTQVTSLSCRSLHCKITVGPFAAWTKCTSPCIADHVQ